MTFWILQCRNAPFSFQVSLIRIFYLQWRSPLLLLFMWLMIQFFDDYPTHSLTSLLAVLHADLVLCWSLLIDYTCFLAIWLLQCSGLHHVIQDKKTMGREYRQDAYMAFVKPPQNCIPMSFAIVQSMEAKTQVPLKLYSHEKNHRRESPETVPEAFNLK